MAKLLPVAIGVAFAGALAFAPMSHADDSTPVIGTGGNLSGADQGSSCAARTTVKFEPQPMVNWSPGSSPTSSFSCSR